MEIFGLVIIVILLAMGLLFAVVILTKTPTRSVERVKESIQAANFLNTMMGTTSQACGKRTVRELLQDCAVAGVDNGQWIGAAECEKGNTCETAQTLVSEMLNKTLGEWGKDYWFFINGTQSVELIQTKKGPCKGEREGSTRPEKVRPGLDIKLTLYICS